MQSLFQLLAHKFISEIFRPQLKQEPGEDERIIKRQNIFSLIYAKFVIYSNIILSVNTEI